jgi:uncharacterized membrane protein
VTRPLEPGAPEPDNGAHDGHGDDAVPPMLPSRGSFVIAFTAVVVAGALGGIIGYGITDVSTDSGAAQFLGALVGAAVGAVGVGIVAVLVLRAMAEWKRQPR